MKTRRTIFLLIAGIFATTATAGKATILPDVQRHLELARTCAQSGHVDSAEAHSGIVLVGDEIKVSVRFDGVQANRQDDCLKALDTSLREWERSARGTVRFVRTEGPADVTVQFQPDVRMRGVQIGGHVSWRRSLRTLGGRVVGSTTKADVKIRTITPSGRDMSVGAMRHAVMHEVGHVLGLEDSSSRGDIMGPLDVSNPNSGPRDYEAAAVRNLREEAQQIRRTAQLSARK